MAYIKREWKNQETLISAEHLNDIEEALEATSMQSSETAAELSNQASDISTLSEELSGLADYVQNDIYAGNIQPMANTLIEQGETLAVFDQLFSDQSSWNADMESRYDGLSEVVEQNRLNVESHTSNASNPHNVYPAQIGAYSSQEVDEKLSPVATINGTAAKFTFDLQDIGQFAHNIRLDLTSNDTASGGYLWSIDRSTSHATLATSNFTKGYNGISTLLDGSSGYTWSQIPCGLSSVTITSSTLSALYGLASSAIPSTGGFDIELSSSANVYLDFIDTLSYKRYFIAIGADTNFKIMHINNKLFIHSVSKAKKIVIDLPEGVVFNTLYRSATATGTTYFPIYNAPQFSASDTFGSGCFKSIPSFIKEGTYFIPFTPNLEETDGYFVTGYINQLADFSIDIKLSYFKSGSALSEMLNLCTGASFDSNAVLSEARAESKKEVQNLINVGIMDPDEDTPGLIYFKYLP